MEKKYTVLRVIATLFKIAGVLVALGTVLIAILMMIAVAAGSMVTEDYGGPIVAFILVVMMFIGGGISALGVYALGESMYLLINLEENTRYTAMLLRDRFYPQPQTPQQPMMPQQPVMPPQPPVDSIYPPPAPLA
jgi:hypothetical protein